MLKTVTLPLPASELQPKSWRTKKFVERKPFFLAMEEKLESFLLCGGEAMNLTVSLASASTLDLMEEQLGEEPC